LDRLLKISGAVRCAGRQPWPGIYACPPRLNRRMPFWEQPAPALAGWEELRRAWSCVLMICRTQVAWPRGASPAVDNLPRAPRRGWGGEGRKNAPALLGSGPVSNVTGFNIFSVSGFKRCDQGHRQRGQNRIIYSQSKCEIDPRMEDDMRKII